MPSMPPVEFYRCGPPIQGALVWPAAHPDGRDQPPLVPWLHVQKSRADVSRATQSAVTFAGSRHVAALSASHAPARPISSICRSPFRTDSVASADRHTLSLHQPLAGGSRQVHERQRPPPSDPRTHAGTWSAVTAASKSGPKFWAVRALITSWSAWSCRYAWSPSTAGGGPGPGGGRGPTIGGSVARELCHQTVLCIAESLVRLATLPYSQQLPSRATRGHPLLRSRQGIHRKPGAVRGSVAADLARLQPGFAHGLREALQRRGSQPARCAACTLQAPPPRERRHQPARDARGVQSTALRGKRHGRARGSAWPCGGRRDPPRRSPPTGVPAPWPCPRARASSPGGTTVVISCHPPRKGGFSP